MATLATKTLAVTINAPYEQVSRDLADPRALIEWGTEFFAGTPHPGEDGALVVSVPRMGGDARFKVEADVERGVFDLYLAPVGRAFGPPLPVRLLRNGDGVDVLWTLARFPGMSAEEWKSGLASMERELAQLKRRHEGRELGVGD